MKYTAHWIKILLALSITAIAACASKPENRSFSSPNSVRQSSLVPQGNINPLLKREYDQALAFMKKADYQRAEKILKGIIEKDASLAGPYINLGIIRLKEGNLIQAEQLLLDAQAKSANNPEVQNYLGIVYRQQGRFNDAEAAYKKAIQLNPNYAKAYLNLGMLYDLYLGNYTAALKSYRQYQVLQPQDKTVENWIIDLNHRMQANNL